MSTLTRFLQSKENKQKVISHEVTEDETLTTIGVFWRHPERHNVQSAADVWGWLNPLWQFVAVCVRQGPSPPATPSSTSFRLKACEPTSSVPAPAPPRPWLWPSGGTHTHTQPGFTYTEAQICKQSQTHSLMQTLWTHNREYTNSHRESRSFPSAAHRLLTEGACLHLHSLINQSQINKQIR